MVYHKYVKKNGKFYGPYYYKNVRDKDGNVKNVFLGKKRPTQIPQLNFKILLALILIIGALILTLNLLHHNKNFQENSYLEKALNFFLRKPDFKTLFSPQAGQPPYFTQNPLPQVNCVEDFECYFDLGLYSTDPDTPHEQLNYSSSAYDPELGFTAFRMDSRTGIIRFTSTNNAETGTFYNIAMIVSDPEKNAGVALQTYNILPVNDPPIMNEIGNINQRADVHFYLDLFATDEEDGTDDKGNLTFSREFIGPSLNGFEFFNATSGIIDFTPTTSQTGIYQINITVTDTGGATDNEVIIFTVYPNSAPYFDPLLENQTAYEDTEFSYDINALDPNSDLITYTTNSTLFEINNETGLIRFTPTYNQIGEYNILVTLRDIYDATNSSEFILTIQERDDSPILCDIGPLVAQEDYLFYFDVNATDEEDAPNGEEDGNLSFFTNSTLFTIDQTTGIINFMPANNQVGIYNINFSVFDSFGNYDFEIVEFTVNNSNDPPNITSYHPLDLEQTVYENQSLYFNMTGEDLDSNTTIFEAIFYRWYLDSIEKTVYSNEFNYNASFDDQGLRNLTGKIFDLAYAEDKISWNVTVINVNRPPYLKIIIPNETSAMNFESDWIYLNNYFSDPDNENIPLEDNNNLTYSFNFTTPNLDNETNSMHINLSINQNTSLVTIKPLNNWTGSELVYFIANDSEFVADSNLINITIAISSQPQPEPTPEPQQQTSRSTTTKTKIASLDVIVSSLITAESNKTIEVPITLKNSGEVDLSYITLSAESSSDDLTLELEKSNFNSLAVGQSGTSQLIISTFNLDEESYKITLHSDVSSPDLSETNIIYLASIPTNLTKLEVEIQFAKDLFEKNPGCLELKELVNQAESESQQGKEELAITLIEAAVQSCSEILQESKIRIPSNQEKSFKLFLPITMSIIALLLVIIAVLYYLYKRK